MVVFTFVSPCFPKVKDWAPSWRQRPLEDWMMRPPPCPRPKRNTPPRWESMNIGVEITTECWWQEPTQLRPLLCVGNKLGYGMERSNSFVNHSTQTARSSLVLVHVKTWGTLRWSTIVVALDPHLWLLLPKIGGPGLFSGKEVVTEEA